MNILKKFSKKFIFFSIYFSILLILLFKQSPYFFVVVNGNSMNPKFKNCDILYFQKNISTLKIDDIIVFNHNGGIYIKRIKACSGQYYTENDYLPRSYSLGSSPINGFEKIKFKKKYGTKIIPNEYYFVEGDNVAFSIDSKTFGPISKREIFGKWIGSQ